MKLTKDWVPTQLYMGNKLPCEPGYISPLYLQNKNLDGALGWWQLKMLQRENWWLFEWIWAADVVTFVTSQKDLVPSVTSQIDIVTEGTRHRNVATSATSRKGMWDCRHMTWVLHSMNRSRAETVPTDQMSSICKPPSANPPLIATQWLTWKYHALIWNALK